MNDQLAELTSSLAELASSFKELGESFLLFKEIFTGDYVNYSAIELPSIVAIAIGNCQFA